MQTAHSFVIRVLWVATVALWAHTSNADQIPIDPARLIAAARAQIGVTTVYDPAFVKLTYPGGDIPRDRGVCTDVVIRAYRDAFGLDLQQLVHDDMAANFQLYPTRWGLNAPDASIDHRRVLNLRVYFTRMGAELTVSTNPAGYAPGDLVTQELPGNLPHIVIVSDTKSSDGIRPLVIQNIGRGTALDDTLFAYKITGHYRYVPASAQAKESKINRLSR